LRGVYPKIPNVYSTDLANLVKALVQVTPQMRPSCERILDMPIVRKRIERFFPQDEFYDSQSSLLNTIRVPKNLLYLTDRLPKPTYESPTQKRKIEEEERMRRKTHDAGNMLPDIKSRKSKGDSQSVNPGTM
jgi:NIMA (never in mitosis gene a)-related kinase